MLSLATDILSDVEFYIQSGFNRRVATSLHYFKGKKGDRPYSECIV